MKLWSQSSVIMTGLDIERILQALESLKSQEIANERNILEVQDYKVPKYIDQNRENYNLDTLIM